MADRLESRGTNVTPEAIVNYSIEADQAQRDIEEATGRKRAVLKRAKAAGINTKAMLDALRMKRGEEEVIRLDLRETIRYCGIIAPQLKLTQAELFAAGDVVLAISPKISAKQAAWEADQGGYRSGLDGGNRSANTFEAGTPNFVAYDKGWLRGQGILVSQLDENTVKADPARAKPSRSSGQDRAAGSSS